MKTRHLLLGAIAAVSLAGLIGTRTDATAFRESGNFTVLRKF